MSHFVVAVFTDKKYEVNKELLDNYLKEKENDSFLALTSQDLYQKVYGEIENEILERTLKYIEYGVSEKTDEYLKENNLLKYEVDKDDPEYNYYHNPNSFWDWYKIGGRWQHLADKFHYKQVKELDIEEIKGSFFGFINLENEYISKGEMWWWDINDATDESSKEFDDKLIQYIKENPDLYILVVDYHV